MGHLGTTTRCACAAALLPPRGHSLPLMLLLLLPLLLQSLRTVQSHATSCVRQPRIWQFKMTQNWQHKTAYMRSVAAREIKRKRRANLQRQEGGEEEGRDKKRGGGRVGLPLFGMRFLSLSWQRRRECRRGVLCHLGLAWAHSTRPAASVAAAAAAAASAAGSVLSAVFEIAARRCCAACGRQCVGGRQAAGDRVQVEGCTQQVKLELVAKRLRNRRCKLQAGAAAAPAAFDERRKRGPKCSADFLVDLTLNFGLNCVVRWRI